MAVYTLKSGKPGKGTYTPWGEVRKFFTCKDPEVIASGPADTGKTLGALWRVHVLASKYSGASIVIARKQLTDVYPSVLQTLLRKVLGITNISDVSSYGTKVDIYGGEKPQWIDYPNGSRIWIAGMDKSTKILSSEHDIIYVNQAEQLDLDDWEVCTTRTSGRAGNLPFSQTIGDANPRHPLHWIKQRSKDGTLTLFDTTHRDNPDIYNPFTGDLTPEGERRLGALKKLTGTRFLRLFKGLWVQPEGAIYSTFVMDAEPGERAHVIREMVIPSTWPRVVAIDPLGEQIAALWLAYDPAASVYHVYREYREPFGLSTREHARNILWLSGLRVNGVPEIASRRKKALFPEPIFAWVGGGPSERQARADWTSAGIPMLEPGVKEVWAGIDRVTELINDFRLVVHEQCPFLISEFGEYQRKTTRSGVVTDTIVDKEKFHMLDCLRYGINWFTGPMIVTEVVDRSVPIGGSW